MDGLSAAASIIAVIQISTQIFGVCQKYYMSVKGARKDIQLLRDEITSLQDVLMKVNDLTDQPGSVPLSTLDLLNQTDGPLVKCRKDLSDLLANLDLEQGRDEMKRFGLRALKWPFNSKEIGKVIAAIGRHKNTFVLALSADNIALSRNINDQITTVTGSINVLTSGIEEIRAVQHTLLTDGYQQKIQQWLSPPDPSSNHKAACEKRQPKTGIWFTEGSIFTKWKITPNPFLWLYGIPGCGKTILSCGIIQDIISECSINPALALVYFYFDFNDTRKQKFDSLIGSLTLQLCTKSDDAANTLNALYSRNQDGKQQPTTDVLIATFQCMLESFQQLYIVLDALDECTEREELLKFLETIAGWNNNKLHIIATSRREGDITDALDPWVTNQVCIQSELVSADIRTYIHEKLQNDRKLKAWPSTVQSEIEATLMDGAHGMFRWVVCQLDELRKCLKLKSLQKTLRSLPKSLHDTYARILLNIEEENCQDAFKLLQWLAYSARPLRIEELAEVVAIELDESSHFDPDMRLREPRDVLTICSSLITTSYSEVPDDYKRRLVEVEQVSLAHFSVKEYLVSGDIRIGPALHYNIVKNANDLIAQACLTYLLQFKEADLPDLFNQDFPLALYAAQNWPQHFQEAEKVGSTIELERLCTELLMIQKNAFLNSVRIYWPRDSDPDRRRYLLESNDHRDSISPLYYALVYGLSRYTQILIDAATNSKNYEYGDEDYLTVLIAASFIGHEAIVQQLLRKCTDVNSEGKVDGNALEAASAAGHDKIVRRLLEAGADANSGIALHQASRYGHETIIHLQLKYGANVNAQGGFFGFALQAASFSGHNDIVKLLLKAGADVNTQGGRFGSALQAASYSISGHNDTVKLLLEAGADVNAQGGFYGPALHIASQVAESNIVEQLVKAGADVNACSGPYNKSALKKAKQKGRDDIVQILLEAGAEDVEVVPVTDRDSESE